MQFEAQIVVIMNSILKGEGNPDCSMQASSQVWLCLLLNHEVDFIITIDNISSFFPYMIEFMNKKVGIKDEMEKFVLFYC